MMAKQKIVFVSGGNRGIGLGLTELMAESGYTVIAGYRDEHRSRKLLQVVEDSDQVIAIQVDVTLEPELRGLYTFISDQFGRLDVLINNAGVNIRPSDRINDLEWTDLEQNMKINVGGPFLTTKYLHPLLKNGKEAKVINISSEMGSIGSSSGGATPYRLSKAALNMLSKNQAIEYQSDGVTVISLHPGWVRTNMGGKLAPLTVRESAGKILSVIELISLENTGQFWSLHGKILPY
ncbi:SDR family oxidoreductase [bacterium]|nr:SDR family oxidoreductase [bacterium]